MSSKYYTTASIVLYNSNPSDIENIIKSFESNYSLVFLIDNSPNDKLKNLGTLENVKYIHNPTNPGFGSAHNLAIINAIEIGSLFHFIVNPDVFFDSSVVRTLIAEMEQDSSIGMIMPKILNLDGTIQNLPKLLPSPFSILFRKIKRPKGFYERFIDRYELRSVSEDKVYNSPILSGCFTLLNLKVITEIGMFDDKYFMYFEDWDLSRRVHKCYKTLYYPKVSVYHSYNSGANKSLKLFFVFLKSAAYYFQKWGWLFDNERSTINKNALDQFNK